MHMVVVAVVLAAEVAVGHEVARHQIFFRFEKKYT